MPGAAGVATPPHPTPSHQSRLPNSCKYRFYVLENSKAVHCVHGLRYVMDSVPPRKARTQTKTCEIGGQNGKGTGFYPSASASPLSISYFIRRPSTVCSKGVATTRHAQVACTECYSDQWRTEGRGFGVFKSPPLPKFRRYRWSPRSHKQEEPASRFPFVFHCVLIWL